MLLWASSSGSVCRSDGGRTAFVENGKGASSLSLAFQMLYEGDGVKSVNHNSSFGVSGLPGKLFVLKGEEMTFTH